MCNLFNYDLSEINPTWLLFGGAVIAALLAVVGNVLQSPLRNRWKFLWILFLTSLLGATASVIIYLGVIVPQTPVIMEARVISPLGASVRSKPDSAATILDIIEESSIVKVHGEILQDETSSTLDKWYYVEVPIGGITACGYIRAITLSLIPPLNSRFVTPPLMTLVP
jgi:hypothetical protein